MKLCNLSLFIFLLLTITVSVFAKGNPREPQCEIAIIGGGASGLYTAFRLGPEYGSRVCVFEKEAELGGRIKDVSKEPGGPVFGVGALRVIESQRVVIDLAQELGITLEFADNREQIISTRGYLAEDSQTLNELAYPVLPDDVSEGELYDELLFGPSRPTAVDYPDFRSYARDVIGVEGYQFLADMSRFRGEFTAPVDARSFLDWLDEEETLFGPAGYPIGGMSQYIVRMAEEARSYGVQIFTSEPVISVNRSGKGNQFNKKYKVITKKRFIRPKFVVIATPVNALKHIKGNVIRDIRRQQEFKDILAIPVVTVTQWWNEPWWLTAPERELVNRLWSTEAALNFIEIPVWPYAEVQNVTRSVYDDSPDTVSFWKTAANRSTQSVDDEIRRGLEYLYPNARIPNPEKTFVQIWPGAWFWLRGGSDFRNIDIARWAIEPLKGENVALVGDSYFPQRATWSDAAYKSAINMLNERFGLRLQDQTVELD
ncbi:MAG: FAD-dependent oxidoreductase [Pseudomonadota bacterium]